MARGLEWVRDNYDTNNSRYIEHAESEVAKSDYIAKKISMADFFEVVDAYDMHTLLPASTGFSIGVAKGKIVNFNYPATSTTNTRIAIRAAVQNTGAASGTFKLQLYAGSTRVAQSSSFTVAIGQTSSTRSMYVTTPGGGSSIGYKIQCVRIT